MHAGGLVVFIPERATGRIGYKMTIAHYYRASSRDEAIELMKAGKGRGKYLAGGTDLLCDEDPADYVVDVRALYRYVRVESGGEVVLGATSLISDIQKSEELRRADGGLLSSCAANFASRQIRNMATVGGNLASAVPSADIAPPLLVLGARCILHGEGGTREVPLEDFFTGPRSSVLGDDMLVEVRFPAIPAGSRCSFQKVGRVKGDIATVNAAAYVETGGGACSVVRLAVGAAAPVPFRATKGEESLIGKPLNGETILAAARLAAEASRPISDVRGSAEYRKEICRVLVERALHDCAGGGEEK